jgi:hypothetical protein
MNNCLSRFDLIRISILASICFLLSMNSYAHHPVQSQYAIDREFTIEGVLKRVEISSPHSFLHMLVVDEHGDEGIVKVERHFKIDQFL